MVLLGVAVSAFMKWSESSKQASKNLKLLADVNKEANKNIEDERAELTKLGAIDFDDANVVELQDKIKSLTSDLEFAKKIFNQLMNGDTTTDDSSEGWRMWR